jgi:hypothetical protein
MWFFHATSSQTPVHRNGCVIIFIWLYFIGALLHMKLKVFWCHAALRAAIQAFKREDHMWQSNSIKAGKRRREQSEQPEGSEGKRLARV